MQCGCGGTSTGGTIVAVRFSVLIKVLFNPRPLDRIEAVKGKS
jgi:hypothetical protein